MFDRFDCWQYRSNANCWDYVRQFLIDRARIPESDVPRFGILPSNKRAMTAAAKTVVSKFIEISYPQHLAIAAVYQGRLMIHVGIVDGVKVRHTSAQFGTRKESISAFESQGAIRYFIHEELWQK